MASGTGGISGIAVAVATCGALLVYAGYRDVNPIQALRDVASGKPPKVKSKDAGLKTSGASQAAYLPGGGNSAVVAAAMKYRGDQYSQTRRHTRGYSDCSSFVSKAYEAAGIDPPSPDTTAGYYLSDRWKKIPLSQAKAGDIVVSATAATIGAHMVLVTGPGMAIGQQNPGDDVETGRISDLMAGTSYDYIAKRYVGGGGGWTVAI